MSDAREARRRVRMTGQERREQLIAISCSLFADKGFEGTSIEEIAAKAQVSKPVVYEHFGGKEGIYAVVVDREVRTLLEAIRNSLVDAKSRRELMERATLALLDYVEGHTDGFRILIRDSGIGTNSGSFASILSDVASQVEDILVSEFKSRKLDHRAAPLYAQMLVGMVGVTGQWWLDNRRHSKRDVAAHLVNLAWNGMKNLESKPQLRVQ
ncbi:MAG TPA: TetR/AcrR family transcriptional regulator [Propionibacterium sp.]|jgi:AcrR family transcriptional regulator|nr:TetR/AcrR family transcriptional regulator [Propionibacterium sp.]